MEVIRNTIFTITIISILFEIATYLIVDKKYHFVLKLLFVFSILISLFSAFNLIEFSEIEKFYSDINRESTEYNYTETDLSLMDEQIEIIKNSVKSDIENKLKLHNIGYISVDVSIIKTDLEITDIIAEVYIRPLDKEKLKSIIFKDGIQIRVHYV